MNLKKLVLISIFSALAFIIMLFSLNIPLFPFFLKIDFSEVPAMLLGYLFGPAAAITVVFAKNCLHFFISSNFGIGELANFIVGAAFVGTASYLYKKKKQNFIFSAVVAVFVMGVTSVFVNLIIIIPLYEKILALPLSKIIEITAAVNPFVDDLFSYLVLSILPFNLIKGSVTALITFLVFVKIRKINI
ncbi:ECF transporter S component [Halanaerobium praevalens]|uniref:Riboflavin transporter n=1 Tax=Halanaerobium praevalens (strain ATCC 33744 / DSM 2228 / GSL) TaxID=572479 RepID=E3DNX3_HALPG|nr:ECF transporter S component [Halanaerobium praevalens]ADO76597.1 hypothetical protein Hprae_0443 [Halanaerobium praevalens DSM 2228]